MHHREIFVSLILGGNGDSLPCSSETPDDGWITMDNYDYCYLMVANAKTWEDANNHCIYNGGHLASIHSNEENEFVRGDVWIGLIKVSKGGQRHWTDNTAYNYDNWRSGGNTKV